LKNTLKTPDLSLPPCTEVCAAHERVYTTGA